MYMCDETYSVSTAHPGGLRLFLLIATILMIC